MNVLLFSVFIDMLGVALVVPTLVLRFTELGGTPESFGVLSSVYAVSQLVGGVAVGFLGDRRLGRKRALQLSFAGAGVSYLLVGLADTLLLLVVSRVIVGLTKQTMTCSTALATSFSDGASRMQSLGRLSSTMTLAFIVGQSVGGALASRYGRRATCFIASALFALDLYLVQVLLPASEPSQQPDPPPQQQPNGVPAATRAEKDGGGARSKIGALGMVRAALRRSAVAFSGGGGRMLLLRLFYALLMRSAYSMHALYESRCWALTPALSGTLASYSQLLGLAVDWALVGRLASHVPEGRLLCLCLRAAECTAAAKPKENSKHTWKRSSRLWLWRQRRRRSSGQPGYSSNCRWHSRKLDAYPWPSDARAPAPVIAVSLLATLATRGPSGCWLRSTLLQSLSTALSTCTLGSTCHSPPCSVASPVPAWPRSSPSPFRRVTQPRRRQRHTSTPSPHLSDLHE